MDPESITQTIRTQHSHGHVNKIFRYARRSKQLQKLHCLWRIFRSEHTLNIIMPGAHGLLIMPYAIASIKRFSSQTRIEFRSWIATDRTSILLSVPQYSYPFLYPAGDAESVVGGFSTALAWNYDVILANPRSSRRKIDSVLEWLFTLNTAKWAVSILSGFKFLYCYDVSYVLRMQWEKALLCLGECNEIWSLFVEENWPLWTGPRTSCSQSGEIRQSPVDT